MRGISEQFRHEISKRRSEISVLISGKTTREETELQAENRDLTQKLQDLESCYISWKQETNVWSDENKSLITTLRLLNNEIEKESKLAAQVIKGDNLQDSLFLLGNYSNKIQEV